MKSTYPTKMIYTTATLMPEEGLAVTIRNHIMLFAPALRICTRTEAFLIHKYSQANCELEYSSHPMDQATTNVRCACNNNLSTIDLEYQQEVLSLST